jgi:hypothetical protein
MLQQALASRRIAIERTDPAGASLAQLASAPAPQKVRPSYVVVSWPYQPADTSKSVRPVPSVEGEEVRQATLALHRSGFRVDLKGLGKVTRTSPGSGESAAPGTTVAVWTER